MMKGHNYLICFLLLYSLFFGSCQKDKHSEIADCYYNKADSSSNHPQNAPLNALVQKYAAQGYPGFVLCVYDSINGLWVGSAGMACIETNETLKACNLHHSASVSKIYIATAILKLFEQGKLDINSLAINYLPLGLPNIANLNNATIKNLLNHSSGIYDFNNNPELYADAINDPFIVKSWKDHLNNYVSGEKPAFPVGTSIEYSNTNYLLLGLVIENVYGKSLGEALNELIFVPASLNETYYKSSPGYPNIPGLSNNYFEPHDGLVQNCTSMQLHFAGVSMGHEGIIASPGDYVKFLDELLSNKILQPSTMKLMDDFQLVPNSSTMYGLGLFSINSPSGRVIGHSGGGFGTMTFLFQVPGKKRTVFFASNLGSIFKSGLSDKFCNEIFEEILENVNY